MGGGDDRPHPGLVARDRWEPDALREDALLEQSIRQRHRATGLAGDDRRDRAFAHAGVEAQLLKALLEESGVLPELLDQLRFVLQMSIAPMQVAATEGGWEVENRKAARGGRGIR